MALGPKEMGEAIIANLKTKTGKDLNQWLVIAKDSKLTEQQKIRTYLKEMGLGAFQANAVTERYLGEVVYDDFEKLINNLFQKYPEQRIQMENITKSVQEKFTLVLRPCKGYVPLYSSKNKIVMSFKPTSKGLYIGLICEIVDFKTIPHAKSRGGSERIKFGFYVDSESEAIDNLHNYLSEIV